MTYKVFGWSAGSVGKQAARVALERESLELVGMHVFSDAKAGKDVGELLGVDRLFHDPREPPAAHQGREDQPAREQESADQVSPPCEHRYTISVAGFPSISLTMLRY